MAQIIFTQMQKVLATDCVNQVKDLKMYHWLHSFASSCKFRPLALWMLGVMSGLSQPCNWGADSGIVFWHHLMVWPFKIWLKLYTVFLHLVSKKTFDLMWPDSRPASADYLHCVMWLSLFYLCNTKHPMKLHRTWMPHHSDVAFFGCHLSQDYPHISSHFLSLL